MNRAKIIKYRLKDGTPLTDWCKENKIPYPSVHRFIESSSSIEEACKKAISKKGKKNNSAKLFIGNITFRQYCIKHKLNYGFIYYHLQKGEKFENILKNNYGLVERYILSKLD